ncbi:MAG: cytoplasmic iron level regulating protein YaaA (DUF328/UPF0246 family) [Crocinitomicaceae bacterium]|jgi:cytoplasmic iron level regulating protein YaaA (DUF328/UPF0246 family)
MKIIFSPTKSQQIPSTIFYNTTPILFLKKSEIIRNILKEFSLKELQKKFKLSDTLANKIYQYYQNDISRTPVIQLFTGISFKQLQGMYQEKYHQYIQNHIVITSAAYGLLRPFDAVEPYRLDMKDIIMKENIYSFWKEEIYEYFKKENCILNLASLEYSKMIPNELKDKITTVHFLIETKNRFKNVSTASKKQRGKILDYCIKNEICDISLLKKYSSDGFTFNKKKSNKNSFYYIYRK